MVDFVIETSMQFYGEKKDIDFIDIFPLKRSSDETGSFTELLRMSNGNFDVNAVECLNVKQINFSELAPLAIKAFHVHKTQTDLIYVPPSCKVKLVVADIRADMDQDNPRVEQIILGDCQSRLVKIPPGIAHGFQNLLDSPATIIYFVDINFVSDWADKNFQEYRIPYDIFGEEIWKEPTD